MTLAKTACEQMLEDEKLTVQVEIPVPYDRLLDLLTSAFEGGSNYWINLVYDEELVTLKAPAQYLQEVPFLGGTLLIEPNEEPGKIPISGREMSLKFKEDEEDEGGFRNLTVWKLDLDAIIKGIKTMASLKKGEGGHHWPNFLNDEADAETGDVFLQCCLFGEIVFG